MVRSLVRVMAVAVLMMGCSSGDPLAVELSHPQGQDGPLPFEATGPAVDEASMCSHGTMDAVDFATVDGEAMTDEDWADMYDAAMESGSVAERTVTELWTCADETGSFTIESHNRFDFATFESEGRQDVGTWEITSGTSWNAELTGSGDVFLDVATEEVIYAGEVRR